MVPVALSLLVALQVPDSTLRSIPPDAWADTATASFVARLRAARDRNERLVTSYTAVVRQRIGVGLRALSRDRMLYRQEVVARIDWQRDTTSTIEVIGAREGVPIALRGDRVPEDLEDDLGSLVINPAQDYLRVFGSGGSGDGFVFPLREGGEADYRYAAGDTTTITLPDGRAIRLASLRVTPRRSDWRLLTGTLWFDADSHGLVQMVVRPARPYEFRRDSDPDDRSGVPAFVNPVGEVKYITIEYGLYESRWWMPRYMAIDAVGTMGSWLGMPIRVERVYDDYEVEGGTPPPAGSTFRPAGTIRRADPGAPGPDPEEQRRRADSVRTAIETCVAEALAGRDTSDRAVRRQTRSRCRRAVRQPNLAVIIPADTTGMLSHPELGPPILAMGDLITESELRGLTRAIEGLPAPRWGPRLDLPDGVGAVLRHARFNRIEALSIGAGGRLALGPATLDGLARLGIADRVPNAELSLSRPSANGRIALTAYRRLTTANPEVRPLGVINSTLGLLAQRDDGEYYRTLGMELVAGNTNAGWWHARVFVQRERPAFVETRAALPHLFDRERAFRPNILADSADQLGGAFTLRGSRALSRTVTLGAEATADGAIGDFDFARGSAALRVFVTPPQGPLAWAATVSAGTSRGSVPVQSRWYLGGAPTLRGYAGGVTSGTAYWSARAEVANSFPGARVILFGDGGWAGDRGEFGSGRPLTSIGIGGSVLDGLVRVDLARGLRAPGGWRLEFYVDGIL